MADVELKETYSGLFPLCKTLENLYFALLQASSKVNEGEYNVFDIQDKKNAEATRAKARVVFSEFDITGYALGASEIVPFDPPLNSSLHIKQNLKKIRRVVCMLEGNEYFEVGQFGRCKCTVRIVHKFQVKSRATQKEVFPVGNICIMKFADTDTLEIMKRVYSIITVSEEKRRIKEELTLMRLEDRVCTRKRKTPSELTELKLMRLEDRVVRKKKAVCSYDCVCKRIASTNDLRLDPLLFDTVKINSQRYMDDYMKALGFVHSVTYV